MSVPEPAPERRTIAQRLMDYGLIAAILVWASAVALMAYHTPDPVWRWSFAALSFAGLGTIGGILWVRRYIGSLTETSKRERQS
ncbi:MAG: hypothetical protein AB1411_00120 [Nitrospirota bacterium]